MHFIYVYIYFSPPFPPTIATISACYLSLPSQPTIPAYHLSLPFPPTIPAYHLSLPSQPTIPAHYPSLPSQPTLPAYQPSPPQPHLAVRDIQLLWTNTQTFALILLLTSYYKKLVVVIKWAEKQQRSPCLSTTVALSTSLKCSVFSW